jgi:hypothetical protein
MRIVSSPKLSSERNFGLMLTAGFIILGLRGIIRGWSWIAYGGCLVTSSICVLLSLTKPHFLAIPNKAWCYLSRWLGKVVSPIVLGVIFLGILTPVSILTRVFGRDELRLKRRASNSYWINRAAPIVTTQSFRNQF